MKPTIKRILMALTTILLAAYPAIAAEQTLKGVVSDAMCGRKHMLDGKTDAECIRVCIKAKSKYALVTPDKVYTINESAADLDKLAGKQVQVTGDVEGINLKITRIAAVK